MGLQADDIFAIHWPCVGLIDNAHVPIEDSESAIDPLGLRTTSEAMLVDNNKVNRIMMVLRIKSLQIA